MLIIFQHFTYHNFLPMKTQIYSLSFLFILFFGLQVTVRAQDTALTNLPCFYITTDNGAPVVSKDDCLNGKLTVAGGAADSGLYNGDIQIKGRGNSTWNFPKKPYKIKLASKYNLLGMPAKAKTWVLLANYADKTLLRNALAFEVSKFLGFAFTPAYRMADVVLNGDYVGTYTITDQVEQGTNRVDVEDQDNTTTTLPVISGGYLIETGGTPAGDNPHYTTTKGMNMSIKYPDDPDDINAQQKDYIVNYVQQYENSLFASNFTDPTNGYRRFVDMKSLVDWYLLNELCANSDCYWSTYMYKHRDDSALYTGPMWDYDIAFNNDNRLGDETYKYMRDWAHDPKVWITRLFQDDGFYQSVKSRWLQLKKAGLLNRMQTVTDSLSQVLNQSQKLNFQRWPILNVQVYLELAARGSYRNEVKFLKKFVNTHAAWLNGEFTGLRPNTPVKIVSEQTGKAWEIAGQPSTDGAQIVQFAVSDHASQRWQATNLNNGYYTLTNLYTGKVVTNNSSFYPDTVLRQTTGVVNSAAQQWRIINTGNKKYGIVNRLSGLAADNYGAQTVDNNPVIQWTNGIYDKNNQQWLLQNAPAAVAAAPDATKLSFTLSPNPATAGMVSVHINLPSDALVTIFVYDARGLLMQEIPKGRLAKGDADIAIPVARLHSGNYTVTVEAGTEKASRMLIK